MKDGFLAPPPPAEMKGGARWFPLPDFSGLDVKGELVAEVEGDVDVGVLEAGVVAGISVTLEKKGKDEDFTVDHTYVALFSVTFTEGPLVVDVKGRKSMPCDDEGDQLYGFVTFNDDLEGVDMEFNARATHYCAEGSSPEWVLYADSTKPLTFGRFTLEGASMRAVGSPPKTAVADENNTASDNASENATAATALGGSGLKGSGHEWMIKVFGSVTLNLEDMASIPGVHSSLTGSAEGMFSVSPTGKLKRESPVSLQVDVSIKKGLDPEQPLWTLTGVGKFEVPCELGSVATIAAKLEIDAGAMAVGPVDVFATYACGDQLPSTTPRFEVAVEVDALPITKDIVVSDVAMRAAVYELEGGDYRIKVGGSGSVPLPLGAFKTTADVTFSVDYDSSAAELTITSLTVDATIEATIGDPGAPSVEIFAVASYEYPCRHTVSASGEVNMTFGEGFHFGPLIAELTLFCPKAPSDEDDAAQVTAFVMTAMTGDDGKLDLTVGSVHVVVADLRVVLVGKSDASAPVAAGESDLIPFPDFLSLDLEGTLTATLLATTDKSGDAAAALEAEMGLAAAFSKGATADAFDFDYNYTTLLRFRYESENIKIDLVGRKSKPCDVNEGDSLSGTFVVSTEAVHITVNARAVRHCEGASPKYVVEGEVPGDSQSNVGAIKLQGATMYAEGFAEDEDGDKLSWNVNITATISADLDDFREFPGVDLSITPTAFASITVGADGSVELNQPLRVSIPFSFVKGSKDTPELTMDGVAEFSIPCEDKIVVKDINVTINTGGLKVDKITGNLVKYCAMTAEDRNTGLEIFQVQAEIESLESINGFSLPSASIILVGYDVEGQTLGFDALLNAEAVYNSSNPVDLLVHANVEVSNVEVGDDGKATLNEGGTSVIAKGNLTYSHGDMDLYMEGRFHIGPNCVTESASIDVALLVVGDALTAEGDAKVGCIDEESGDRQFEMNLRVDEWNIADGVKLTDGEINLAAVKKGGARFNNSMAFNATISAVVTMDEEFLSFVDKADVQVTASAAFHKPACVGPPTPPSVTVTHPPEPLSPPPPPPSPPPPLSPPPSAACGEDNMTEGCRCGGNGGGYGEPDNPRKSTGLCCDKATKMTTVGQQITSFVWCVKHSPPPAPPPPAPPPQPSSCRHLSLQG